MNINTIKAAHEAFETYLSFNNTSDKRLVGMFEKKDDGTYTINDLRMSDFSRIEQYKVMDSEGNESEPKGAINIAFNPTISFAPKANSYYYFFWKYTDSNPNNLCEITIDLTKPIEILTPYGIVDLLYRAQMNLAHGNAKTNNQTLDTLTKQLTASGEEIFIYELLQNANDYPHKKGDEVDVEIRLTDNYLIFRHTGAEFSPKNVAALCNANDKDKTDNPDAIGYKGIGFKTVFNNNNYIYLLTGGFSFCYDSDIKRKKANIPWKVTPIWKERDQIDDEYGKLFWDSHESYRVQFAMRPIKHDKLRQGDKSYLAILKGLFKDETKILFIPNLGHVKVYLDDESIPTFDCSRKSINWCLSEVFEYDIDPNITESINAELKDDEENETSRIPVKYRNFKKTGVSFACKVDGRKLIPQDNAIMYCYLPAETANWGFKFFMNSDMIPNGPRDDIEHGIDLNFYLAENAGKMFYEWIYSLVKSGKYDYDTIFALIPNFAECKTRRPINKGFVDSFQKGFESCLEKPLIPTESGEIVAIENIIWDETMITSSGIISDKQFYVFSGMNGNLVHSSLRKNENFKKFIKRYLPQIANNNIFCFDSLKTCVTENEDMKEWLNKVENNGHFLDFLMSSQDERLKEFSSLPIYIDNEDKLCSSEKIYYSGDNVKQAILYLQDFIKYLPHLSFMTLDYFSNHKESKWSKFNTTVGFKKFNAGDFVSKVLFSDTNKPGVLLSLQTLGTSVNFFKFLAHNAQDNYGDFDFRSLPFFNSDGKIVDSFSNKLVFYEDTTGKEKAILQEKWFNESWAYFINEAYTSDDKDDYVWKFLLKKELVKFFDTDTIFKEVISNKSNLSYVAEQTRDNLPASISFVHYVFKNRRHLTESTDFKQIPLCVADLDGNTSFEICRDINVFPFIDRKYLGHSWIKSTWMYKLDNAYQTGISDNDKALFQDFLSAKFGLKILKDRTFYIYVAKKNRVYIGKMMADSKQVNKDFYAYLATNLSKEFMQDDNLSKTFSDLPYINSENDIVVKGKATSREYLYNSVLADIVGESWVPNELFSLVSPKYDFTNSNDLFKRLGFIEYSDSDFGSFFANILYGNVELNSIEQVSDFHHYMCSRLSKLNEEQKECLLKTPTYLFSPKGPRKYPNATKLYIQSDSFDITNDIISGLLPEYNAIDKALCDTEDMVRYWKALGNTVFNAYECNKWLKTKKSFFETSLNDANQNIKFWRWLKNKQGERITSNLNELKGFPILIFSERDSKKIEANTTLTVVDDGIYMPNLYHNGIEAFANRYGKKRYVSESYSEDREDTECNKKWRVFFKNVGIKDNVKDVIRQIIDKDLATLQDEYIPSVLVDEFSDELNSEWDSLKDKLACLQVKLKNSNTFMPISQVVIVDTKEYSSEPLEFIPIQSEIAPSYMSNTLIRKLIIKIGEAASATIIKDRASWMTKKVDTYINFQSSIQIGSQLFATHIQFVEAFADIYKRNYPNWGFDEQAKKVLLFDKNGALTSPAMLTLGHAYNPYCDFEGNGISEKSYVHEAYSMSSNRENLLEFFDKILHVQMTFTKDDLIYLSQKEFCNYYWKRFLPSYEEPQTELLSWAKSGLLKDKSCIPNRLGNVCRTESLYSLNIKEYVENKVGSWEQKLPDVQKASGKIRTILDALKFKDRLCFSDCLDHLLNTKTDSATRSIVLGWMTSSYSAECNELVRTYRNNDNAKWQNGQKHPAHISTLYALSNNNNKIISAFRTNEHIINVDCYKASIGTDNWFKALKILGIPVISDDDLEPLCPVTKDETSTIRRDIKLRLLALIASREGQNWYNTYCDTKMKLSVCKFYLCTNISYKYHELLADNEKLFCQNKTFYYIKSWQSKQVFIRLVEELNEYLKLPYDANAINDILDYESYSDIEITEFINDNCLDLLDDIAFVKELEALSEGIKEQLNITALPMSPIASPVDKSQDDIATVGSVKGESYNPYSGTNKPSEEDDTDSISDDENSSGTDSSEQTTEDKSDVDNNGSRHNDNNSESNVPGSPKTAHNEGSKRETTSNGSSPKTSMPPKDKDTYDPSSKRTTSGYGTIPDEYVDDTEVSPVSSTQPKKALNYNDDSSDKTPNKPSKHSKGEYTPYQRQRGYDPLDEIASTKEKETFDPNDADADEQELAHNEDLFNSGLTRDEIADQNTLVKTRMFNSFAEKGYELDMNEVDFIRHAGSQKEYDVKTKSGKYIHVVSAYNGIMYLSPVFWNRVQRKDCVVCVVLSHRARNFIYIHNREELEKLIGGDELVVKVSGHNKIDLVNQLFGKSLHNAIRKVYTMVRIKSGTKYDVLFKPARSEWDESENSNEDL